MYIKGTESTYQKLCTPKKCKKNIVTHIYLYLYIYALRLILNREELQSYYFKFYVTLSRHPLQHTGNCAMQNIVWFVR